MTLGQRIENAIAALGGHEAEDIATEHATNAAQGELLDTLGSKTSEMAAAIEELKTEIAALPATTDTTALQAKVDDLSKQIASIDAAFPDEAVDVPAEHQDNVATS